MLSKVLVKNASSLYISFRCSLFFSQVPFSCAFFIKRRQREQLNWKIYLSIKSLFRILPVNTYKWTINISTHREPLDMSINRWDPMLHWFFHCRFNRILIYVAFCPLFITSSPPCHSLRECTFIKRISVQYIHVRALRASSIKLRWNTRMHSMYVHICTPRCMTIVTAILRRKAIKKNLKEQDIAEGR